MRCGSIPSPACVSALLPSLPSRPPIARPPGEKNEEKEEEEETDEAEWEADVTHLQADHHRVVEQESCSPVGCRAKPMGWSAAGRVTGLAGRWHRHLTTIPCQDRCT